MPALQSDRAINKLTKWCRLWHPALFLHARLWWPFGCTLASQMHVFAATIGQSRRSPTAILVSESERRYPKFVVGMAWSHEATPRTQLANSLAQSEGKELLPKIVLIQKLKMASSHAFWYSTSIGLGINSPPSIYQEVIACDLRAMEQSNATGGRMSASRGLTWDTDDR